VNLSKNEQIHQTARLIRKSLEKRPEPPKEGEDPLAVALRFAKKPDFLPRSVAASKAGNEKKASYWLRRAMGLKA
jgi:hypothetical protein